MSAVVADRAPVQKMTSLAMAPKPRLNVLTTRIFLSAFIFVFLFLGTPLFASDDFLAPTRCAQNLAPEASAKSSASGVDLEGRQQRPIQLALAIRYFPVNRITLLASTYFNFIFLLTFDRNRQLVVKVAKTEEQIGTFERYENEKRVSSESRAKSPRHAHHLVEINEAFLLPIQDTKTNHSYFLPALSMEVQAGSLNQLIAENVEETKKWEFIFRVARDTARGLLALHKAGYLHLDIKMSNLFYQGENSKLNIKIGDFGAATVKRASQEGEHPLTISAFGTPGYLSLEQMISVEEKTRFKKGPQFSTRRAGSKDGFKTLLLACDAKFDLYALRVTLAELIAGHSVTTFDSKDPNILMFEFEWGETFPVLLELHRSATV